MRWLRSWPFWLYVTSVNSCLGAFLLAPEEGPVGAIIGAAFAWFIPLLPSVARLLWWLLVFVGQIVLSVTVELALVGVLACRWLWRRCLG